MIDLLKTQLERFGLRIEIIEHKGGAAVQVIQIDPNAPPSEDPYEETISHGFLRYGPKVNEVENSGLTFKLTTPESIKNPGGLLLGLQHEINVKFNDPSEQAAALEALDRIHNAILFHRHPIEGYKPTDFALLNRMLKK